LTCGDYHHRAFRTVFFGSGLSANAFIQQDKPTGEVQCRLWSETLGACSISSM